MTQEQKEVLLAHIDPIQIAQMKQKITGVTDYLKSLDDSTLFALCGEAADMRDGLMSLAQRDTANNLVNGAGDAVVINPNDVRVSQARYIDLGVILMFREWADRRGLLAEMGFGV